ncbi:MAG: histone deacetylase, partial [Myxococcales bacterium]
MRTRLNLRLRVLRRLALWRTITVWYHPDFRLPLTGVESSGIEPRRADFAAWFLLERGGIRPADLRTPLRIGYHDLARVHAPELLESLTTPESLARIFAVDPSDVPVDSLLNTVRLACGATLEAAQESLRSGAPALNLLGGFHHAGPTRAGGFCAVNDIAVAVATLRAQGFVGQVVILDVDAHPPDGIAECLASDPHCWIGSLSGADWGPLPKVDEVLLPKGTTDAAYLDALEALLARMPEPRLAFVIAGGDPLAGDRLGNLALSLDGLRRRDLRIAEALEGLPQVWVPGGGYSARSWTALAGTGLALARKSRAPIPEGYDPLRARFARVARAFPADKLSGKEDDFGFTIEDLEPLKGRRGPMRLLDFYTAEGIEYALFRYGILDHLQRLGFGGFRVELE